VFQEHLIFPPSFVCGERGRSGLRPVGGDFIHNRTSTVFSWRIQKARGSFPRSVMQSSSGLTNL
jgi:hypothetical protein